MFFWGVLIPQCTLYIYLLDTGQDIAHWNYQWWPQRWFPLRFFFQQINYSCGMKVSINFKNVYSKPTRCILNKLDTGFFPYSSLTLWLIGIICICPCMFHYFYLSVLWSLLVNPAGKTSQNSRMEYLEKVWNLFKVNNRDTRATSMFLNAFTSMRTFRFLFF